MGKCQEDKKVSGRISFKLNPDSALELPVKAEFSF